MTQLLRRMFVAPERNSDLLLAWLALAVFQVTVPADAILARADLAPWLTLCVAVAAGLRARTLGDGPHPSLTPRRALWSGRIGRVGLILAPVAVLRWHDAAWLASVPVLVEAVGWSLAVGIATAIGARDGEVAWRPRGGPAWLWWVLRVSAVIGIALFIGLRQRDATPLDARLVGSTVAQITLISALLGLQFLSLGLLPDRLAWRWQRRAAGRRDGADDEPSRFAFALALFGPAGGYVLLMVLNHRFGAAYGFGQATVSALYVLAWAAVLWPPRIPVAVSCLLHEIQPAGGHDPAARDEANTFEQPPVGALRLDPRGVKRLRVLHHWVVPVHDARVEDLDDPVRPLWRRRPAALPFHVLGNAAFEPDIRSQAPQWRTVTIRLDALEDITALDQGSVQTRRLAVLRPFASRGPRAPAPPRTYRWDSPVAPGAVQVVDATTDRITLQDGDILVLSTEGVARAYELEIGAPVYAWSEIGHVRPPQLEDYVGGGA